MGTKPQITHTKFTRGLMDTELVSNRVKASILKFLETVQAADVPDLFKMMSDFTKKLEEIGTNPDSEEVRLNGILLIIVQDEIKSRNTEPIEPMEN